MTDDRPGAAARLVIYANAFFLGAIVMGFEMLASRYLYPYFGGTIFTWAMLISAVLAALMAGYFIGGRLADRFPSGRALALLILPAALYMAIIPYLANSIFIAVFENLGDGFAGLSVACAVLVLPPLTLLGIVSPFAVRLILPAREQAGRVSGQVYAISTLGSIIGTLVTAFVLIPNIGSRSVTLIFAVAILLSGLSLYLFGGRGRAN